MTRSFLGPQKNFVPYLTPSSTFIPYMTLRCIFHPATVNCAVKRRFCPCGPHHPSPSSPPPGRRVLPQPRGHRLRVRAAAPPEEKAAGHPCRCGQSPLPPPTSRATLLLPAPTKRSGTWWRGSSEERGRQRRARRTGRPHTSAHRSCRGLDGHRHRAGSARAEALDPPSGRGRLPSPEQI